MTTLDHLRKLIDSGWLGHKQVGAYVGPCCYHCREAARIDPDDVTARWICNHAFDCPWVAAKAHVEDTDRLIANGVPLGYDPAIDASLARLRSAVDHLELAIDRRDEPLPAKEGTELTHPEQDEVFGMLKIMRTYAEFSLDKVHPSIRDNLLSDLRKTNAIINRRGFTLLELLVVIAIILLVSVLTIPTISGAISHRQVSEGARTLQAVLAGARDAAIRDNQPSGIRLIQDPLFSGIQPAFLPNSNGGLPIPNPNPLAGRLDPSLPLAYNRIVPIAPAPSYMEGAVFQVPVVAGQLLPTGALASIGALAYPVPSAAVPAPLVSGTTVLVLAEAVVTQVFNPVTGVPTIIPNPPTSWFWNIRLGDKVQINNAGPWYTVVGPMVVPPQGITINGSFYANPDMFCNVGQPGTALPWTTTQFGQVVTPEFLLLVNGRDDNANGWIDEGWDGVDNDGINGTDDVGEWKEVETWLGAPPTGAQLPYSISRRPVPQISAREVQLPSDVVIDATTWGTTQERTRVPSAALNSFTGVIDIMINPDGSVLPTTLYSSPSSVGMSGAFYHFWLAERGDVYAPATPLVTGGAFSLPMPSSAILQSGPGAPVTPNAYAALMAGTLPGFGSTSFVLKGETRLTTMFSKTGQTSTNDNPTFNVANVSQPFLDAQQGTQSP
jgi:prepilin-type N-terminal cleavage/methylation domain-containing protein